MDVLTFIVEVVTILFIATLAWVVWWKLIDKAWSYLEELLGKKISGWISIITTFGLIGAVIVDAIRP